MKIKSFKIGVIGLGYVGLPIANEFSKKFTTYAYDKSKKRILELKKYFDRNMQLSFKELKKNRINLCDNLKSLSTANIFIITVPTPIDKKNIPDLSLIISATKELSKILKKGDIVVYESTVYPGLTKEICVPILEKNSKLKYNFDFFCGYSPERINPGDKSKNLKNINKIVSGSNKYALKIIYEIYKKIIKAKVIKTSSIEVAEAAKVIENTQRDLNIGLINELSQIFNKLNIDTEEVLKAAASKWNFNYFTPGLVGGHCIGVDPYYLTYKSKKLGYNPSIILAGRKVNDNMSKYVADKALLSLKKIKTKKNILIMGCTFKENCPDIRNSKVFDVIKHIKKKDKSLKLHIFDPNADKNEVYSEYKIKLINKPKKKYYDLIILAVSHQIFKNKNYARPLTKYGNKLCKLFDLKFFYKQNYSDFRL